MDCTRLTFSKHFRRLSGKTQVYIAPDGDHYTTRLTHTTMVTRVTRQAARALGLDEDLAEAISLGHDLQHSCFGHAGEEALNDLTKSVGGFAHAEQSLRAVDFLENEGRGLNLSNETRDGIRHHGLDGCLPYTPEGQIVRLLDKIYIFHDLEDAVRANILKPTDIPEETIKVFGDSLLQQINALVSDLIKTSLYTGEVKVSDEIWKIFLEQRRFNYEYIYLANSTIKEAQKGKMIINYLFNYFMKNPGEMPSFYNYIAEKDGRERAVADWIAGMTDRFAIRLFKERTIPVSLS
ncbi:MAG: HD domain-containing protein [Desulfotomaculaceae bacterium]|nr:HD domain-containing protein [Desulfotomaculaceae bacterium]